MQTGPRFLTDSEIYSLTLLNPSNVPANQPDAMHDQYGAIGQSADGRVFRFAKFPGTSAILPGLLLVAPVAPANSTALAISATQPSTTATGNGATGASALAAGSLSFNVTNGVTAVTQDEFQFVEILNDDGGTFKIRLRGNTADSGSGTITLFLRDPLPPTITTLVAGDDTVNLRLSPWNQPTASLTQGEPVGVTIVNVPQSATASYAGWLQTRGEAYVAATSGTLGYPVAQDLSGTAGYVANIGAGAAETVPQFGYFYTAAASSAASVFLKID